MVEDDYSLLVNEDPTLDDGFVVELRDRFLTALGARNLSPNAVAIILVTPQRMQQLNRDYHSVDAATDVLSFPYQDPSSQVTSEHFVQDSSLDNFLGDIALCVAIAQKQAEKKEIKLIDELQFLFCHGLEHLHGHHHD